MVRFEFKALAMRGGGESTKEKLAAGLVGRGIERERELIRKRRNRKKLGSRIWRKTLDGSLSLLWLSRTPV